jgi:isopropylmalate/homocitrate/citramalate synthase
MGWDFSRTPLEFSRKVYQAAVDAGAVALTIVDTFAVATPTAVGHTFRKMREWFPGVQLEFHVHNDFGMGMGAALAAVENGAAVIHTAMNALGERTGNLATEEAATTLGLLLGGRTNVNKTVFGQNCFGIESGVVSHYAEAMRKNGIKPAASPYLPEVVGREEHDYFIGYLSGRLTVDHYLEKYNISATHEQREAVLEAVKAECLVRKALLPEASFVKIARKVVAGGK